MIMMDTMMMLTVMKAQKVAIHPRNLYYQSNG